MAKTSKRANCGSAYPNPAFLEIGAAISSATPPKGDHQCDGVNLLRRSPRRSAEHPRLHFAQPPCKPIRCDAEIETAIAALGAEQAGLVEFSSFLAAHMGTIISSTARHNVPAIYEGTLFARRGGLIAYGASFTDMFRRAAVYVDRILRGERPADLPVQAPTKFELIINLKTAKALGLNVPPALLATADEVIE